MIHRLRVLLYFLIASPLWAGYADHLNGSGTLNSPSTLAICGDDIWANTDQYTALPVEYAITGEPIITYLQNEFSTWTVTNFSNSNQSVVNYTPTLSSTDAIVLAYGIGDLRAGTSSSAFKSHYKRMIAALQTAHPSARIYLTNLSPVQAWHTEYQTLSTHFDSYQSVLDEVAREESLTLIDLHELNFSNPKYFVDGLTPVLQGAEFIAERIHEVITGDIAPSMPAIFTHNMVLQRGKVLPIFGRGPAGAAVTVTWDALATNEVTTTTVDSHGYWMATLSAKEASTTGKTLSISVGDTDYNYSNVLIGDVWFAPGQSNMASVNVGQESTLPSEQDLFPAAGYPLIRLLHMTQKWDGAAEVYDWNDTAAQSMTRFDYWNTANGGWYAADTYSDISNFSAVAWCFAKQVHLDENVPVGIVEMAIGGTTIESYISHSGFLSEAEIAPAVTTGDDSLGGMLNWVKDPLGGPNWAQSNVPLGRSAMTPDVVPFPYHPMEHSFLYRSAIEQFIPFSIKGMVWYQGETNADAGNPVSRNKAQYRALVRGWRDDWKNASGIDDKFAFIGVQLPSINKASRSHWPTHRQAMYEFWRESNYSSDPNLRLENVGVASTIELGVNGSNVHPYNKREISERLARMAQRWAYGNTNYHYAGPAANSATADGNKLVISFDPDTLGINGLQAYDTPGGALDYFEVAAEDGIYYDASASIVGNTVEVTSASVAAPVAVRYLHHMAPIGDPATGKLSMLASSAPAIETPNSNSQKIITASPFVIGEENFAEALPKGYGDHYEGDKLVMPDGWNHVTKGTPTHQIVATPEGGSALNIITTESSSNSYIEPGTASSLLDTDICLSPGISADFSVETRMKVTSGTAAFGINTFGANITGNITATAITINGTHSFDNTEYFTLRVDYTRSDDTARLYRNGVLFTTMANVADTTNSRIYLGEGSGSKVANLTIDYLRYWAPFTPEAPELNVVNNGFEIANRFHSSSTQTLLDLEGNLWDIPNGSLTADSPIANDQDLTLTAGQSARLDIRRTSTHGVFELGSLRLKARASTNARLTITPVLSNGTPLTALTTDLDSSTSELYFDLTNPAIHSFTFSADGELSIDDVQAGASLQMINQTNVTGYSTTQSAVIGSEVTLTKILIEADSGSVTHQIDNIQLAVPAAIQAGFKSDWNSFRVLYSTTDDIGTASELSSITADLSDVPLYGFFDLGFDSQRIVEGSNYLWVLASYDGPITSIPPLSIDSLDLTRASTLNKINPPEQNLADPYISFIPFTVDTDLLLHYDFTDLSSTSVSDLTNNGNDGSVNGIAPANSGGSADFSTGNGYIATPVINAEFHTIAFRYRSNRNLSGDDSGSEPIMNFGLGNTGSHIWSGASSSGLSGETISLAKNGATAINSALSADTWHHIAFVWNGSNYDAYFDGVLQTVLHKNTNESSGLIQNSGIELGARSNSSLQAYANDALDDLRIYSRALDSNEVNALANPAADADADGIHDSWEYQHNGNLGRAPNSDDDGDGRTLEQEFIADTDPNSGHSQLANSEITRASSTSLDLRLGYTSSARTYTLLYSTDLGMSETWVEVPGYIDRPGTDGPLLLNLENAGATEGFYKVLVELP